MYVGTRRSFNINVLQVAAVLELPFDLRAGHCPKNSIPNHEVRVDVSIKVVRYRLRPVSGFAMLGCLLATLSRHNHTSRRLSRTNPCPDGRDLCPDVPTMFPIVMSSSRHHRSCSNTPIYFSIYIHVVDRSNPRFSPPLRGSSQSSLVLFSLVVVPVLGPVCHFSSRSRASVPSLLAFSFSRARVPFLLAFSSSSSLSPRIFSSSSPLSSCEPIATYGVLGKDLSNRPSRIVSPLVQHLPLCLRDCRGWVSGRTYIGRLEGKE